MCPRLLPVRKALSVCLMLERAGVCPSADTATPETASSPEGSNAFCHCGDCCGRGQPHSSRILPPVVLSRLPPGEDPADHLFDRDLLDNDVPHGHPVQKQFADADNVSSFNAQLNLSRVAFEHCAQVV